MDITAFFDWQYLATFAGAAAATGIVTQFLKGPVDRFFKIPTQVLSYLVALVILILAQVFTGTISAPNAVLALFNALLVATAASGTISGVKRLSGK